MASINMQDVTAEELDKVKVSSILRSSSKVSLTACRRNDANVPLAAVHIEADVRAFGCFAWHRGPVVNRRPLSSRSSREASLIGLLDGSTRTLPVAARR